MDNDDHFALALFSRNRFRISASTSSASPSPTSTSTGEKKYFHSFFFSFIKGCFDADDDVTSEKMKNNILMVSWSDENVTF